MTSIRRGQLYRQQVVEVEVYFDPVASSPSIRVKAERYDRPLTLEFRVYSNPTRDRQFPMSILVSPDTADEWDGRFTLRPSDYHSVVVKYLYGGNYHWWGYHPEGTPKPFLGMED